MPPAGNPPVTPSSGRPATPANLNAAAFACSIVTILLILILALWRPEREAANKMRRITLYILRTVMALDLLSLMGAYAAGTSKDTRTAGIYMASVGAYVIVHVVLGCVWEHGSSGFNQRTRELLTLLSTFAVSITYPAGLNAPGGFWDNGVGPATRSSRAASSFSSPATTRRSCFRCSSPCCCCTTT